MKSHTLTPFILLLATALEWSHAVKAQEVTIRIEVISIEKVAAMTMLHDPRGISDPAAILADIEGLKRRSEADVVTIPSLLGALPFNTKTRGRVAFEIDAGGSLNRLIHIHVSAATGTPGQGAQIITAVDVKAGTPKFLGTLEPRDPGDQGRTWLMFLHVHR